MKINATIECPCCNGTGIIGDAPLVLQREKQIEIAKKLAEKGFSLREIAKIMGYKSQGSIKHLLDNS